MIISSIIVDSLQEVEKTVPEAASVCNKVKTHLMEEIKKIKVGMGPGEWQLGRGTKT